VIGFKVEKNVLRFSVNLFSVQLLQETLVVLLLDHLLTHLAEYLATSMLGVLLLPNKRDKLVTAFADEHLRTQAFSPPLPYLLVYSKALLVAKVTQTVVALETCATVNTLTIGTITGGTSAFTVMRFASIKWVFTRYAIVGGAKETSD